MKKATSSPASADQPMSGKVADVERLLQVLAVLRHSETAVPRSALVAAVRTYAEDDRAARSGAPEELVKKTDSLNKKIRLDMDRLREVGFQVESTSGEGLESTWVLRPTPWRVPVPLDDQEEAALSWVMRAADAEAADSAGLSGVPEPLRRSSLAAVLGDLPGGLGLVHAALAGSRRLVVDRDGTDTVLEPAQLAAYEGRWYLLARYPGHPQVYGYRLDRLDVVRLGDVMDETPTRVEDPRQVLDPTAWRVHAVVDVELRCSPADLTQVASWFPRAKIAQQAGESVLTFPATHLAAVLDRVIGLAGSARLVAPVDAVEQLRARLLPFVSHS